MLKLAKEYLMTAVIREQADRFLADEEINSDIVVIGGGGTGLCAAVAAAEKGADVILLEKRGLGGNSALAQGFFGAESHIQKRLNLSVPRDEVFKVAVEYGHWKINQRLFRAFVNKSADTVKWLEDKGVTIDRIHEGMLGHHRTWHCPTEGGAEVVRVLHQQCAQLGVRVLIQTPATKILTDETGNIAGVLAKSKDKNYKINCRSVIIGSGGYAGNKELLQKYYPTYHENMYNDGVPNMGDGLLMALALGVDTEGLGNLLLHPHIYPGIMPLRIIARDASLLWVNKLGERFTDETVGNRAPEDGNVVDRQPEKFIYVLFDDKYKKQMIADWKIPEKGWLKGIDLKNLDDDLRGEVEKGGVKISDSWGEIAGWIGAAPEILEATLAEYNHSCEQGYDEVFLKDKKYLKKLATPPYYAVKCVLSFLTTIGGIKINHKMEVLKDNKPFAGLYAGGDAVGGWETDTYCMVLPSSALGFALNSGRIAGENAYEFIKHIDT